MVEPILLAPMQDLRVSRSENRSGLGAAVLVLLLAFLLAFSPISNSDVWLHLATGRALLTGHYNFGVEPFTYSSPDAPWVNHSWLYDLGLYFLYQAGNEALCVAKAILVVVLAGVMVASGVTGRSSLFSACISGLALVALAPWLALKPVNLSLLFLAVSICFLERKIRAGEGGRPAVFSSFWPLWVLFAFWANVDAWFWLGPLTVALYFFGQVFEAGPRAASGVIGPLPGSATVSVVTWGWVLAGGLAACLINPYHFRIFQLQGALGISAAAVDLQQDSVLRNQFFAPFREVYFSGKFIYPAGVAFWLLAFLSLLSFLVGRGTCRRRWAMLWAAFFFLSMFANAAVPFFAVVCVPVLAGNAGQRIDQARWSRAGGLKPFRAFVVVAILTAVLVAWPGWLQIGPRGPRSWRVQMDAAVAAVGQQLSRWCRDGKVPAGNIFNFSPETGNYLAWLCPQLRCFVNAHLHLSPAAAADFVAVREGLTGRKSPSGPDRDWRAVLRDNHVKLLVIHGHELGPTMTVMENLFPAYQFARSWGGREEFPLLFLRGGAAVFGWRDHPTPGPDAFVGLEMNSAREAFASATNAPLLPPEQDTGPMAWWEAFWRAPLGPIVDRDEAIALLTFFDSARDVYQTRNSTLWKSKQLGDLVAAGASPGSAVLECCLHAAPNWPLIEAFRRSLDDGPVETLYLALRAARRAVHENPNDARSRFLLGETYARLVKLTRQRSWGSMVRDLRIAQMMAAFRQALRLNPNFVEAHDRLAEFFQALDYKDLTLEQLQESYRSRALAPLLGRSKKQVERNLENLKNGIATLEKEVQDLRERLEHNSANLRPLDRARMAARLGLSGAALNILLKSNIAAFGDKGLEMELRLLLHTGDVDKVREWFNPEHRELLGETKYYWIRAQMEAALGDYDRAGDALRKMASNHGLEKKGIALGPETALAVGGWLLLEAGSAVQDTTALRQITTVWQRESLRAEIAHLVAVMNREAFSLVLHGVLAVEAGRSEEARNDFRRALAFWRSHAGEVFTDPLSRTSRGIARFFLELFAKLDS